MASASYARQIFDKALSLEQGSTILVPCPSTGFRESLRVMLHRERSKYAVRVSQTEADRISIERLTENNKYYLRVQKNEPMQEAMVISADGSISAIEYKPEQRTEIKLKNTEIQCDSVVNLGGKAEKAWERIVRLMLEDGKPNEEILSLVKESFPGISEDYVKQLITELTEEA